MYEILNKSLAWFLLAEYLFELCILHKSIGLSALTQQKLVENDLFYNINAFLLLWSSRYRLCDECVWIYADLVEGQEKSSRHWTIYVQILTGNQKNGLNCRKIKS